MNASDLSKLPKDLLIKLIISLQEVEKDKYTEMIRLYIFKAIREQYCYYDNCDYFKLIDDDKKIVFSNNDTDKNISQCYYCQQTFCDIHENMIQCDACGDYSCKQHALTSLTDKNCFECDKKIEIICSYSCQESSYCKNCDDRI